MSTPTDAEAALLADLWTRLAFTDRVYAHVAKEQDYTAAIERTRRARGP